MKFSPRDFYSREWRRDRRIQYLLHVHVSYNRKNVQYFVDIGLSMQRSK